MNRDSELTRPIAEAGSKIVLEYLSNPKAEGSDKVKIAMAAITAHTRMKATEANDDTNRLGLAKLIYSDPKARETYIKKSMPHMMIEKK
jgi:hypothetical protein